jgi:two-component system, OmpR family, sensor histidine kinase SenX3
MRVLDSGQMAARRIPLALLAPVSLVILVVALGALQYHWVGQVSEADRAQLKQSLDRRAREFADDFDRELGRAYQLFRPSPALTATESESLAKQFDEWQTTSRFPALVKTAYFVAGDGKMTLYEYNAGTRALEPVEWPKVLHSVWMRLADNQPKTIDTPMGRASVFTIGTSTVFPEIPALLVPEPPSASHEMAPAKDKENAKNSGDGERFDVMMAVRSSGKNVVLLLDRDFIAGTMLPALVDRHFSGDGADRFKVSIVGPKSEPILKRGLADDEVLEAARADAWVAFFGMRIETFRALPATSTTQWTTTVRRGEPTSSPSAAVSGAIVMTRPQAVMSDRLSMVVEQQHTATMGAGGLGGSAVRLQAPQGWTIRLQHSAGSLDAAVANARRRNLWLSFGILGVLALSTGLVMINARRSEKLAAQQMDFVATVSHELRTPVAVIRSAAQNLSAGVVQDTDQAKRYGELIDAEGRRLTDMVEQVLEYAGLSGNRRPPTSRPVDLGSLAADVVNTSQSLPESENVTFDIRVDDHVPAVMADEDAIRRALINLVSNAVKHAGAGRWVGVSVAPGSGRDDKHVLVSVTDRGRGIPAEELSHIFEPFYRGRFALDQQIHGNGLGLSLVKRIVEAHGGRITVKSAPEQGSTFTLSLPVASGAVAAAWSPAPGTQGGAPGL